MKKHRKRNTATSARQSFSSESALCEVLRTVTKELGWLAYPETSGWDLILVRPLDGLQVGVQAKLRANLDVLHQALPPRPMKMGPDIRAVLVPEATERGAFAEIAERLQLAVLDGGILRGDLSRWYGYDGVHVAETVQGARYLERTIEHAPVHVVSKRCWLPPYVPDTPAGVPSPVSVSPWRVSAAKFCAEIRTGLKPTKKEIEERGMSFSTWRQWLDPIEGTRPRQYQLRSGTYLPDTEWPDVPRGMGLPIPPNLWKWDSSGLREAEPTWGADTKPRT